MTTTTLKVGQRVRYISRKCPAYTGSYGWVTGNKDGWVLVQFDSSIKFDFRARASSLETIG